MITITNRADRTHTPRHVLVRKQRPLGTRQWQLIRHLRTLDPTAACTAPQIADAIGYRHGNADVLYSLLSLEVRGLVAREPARRRTSSRRADARRWSLTDAGWRV
jgi:hypothetical protein